MGISNSIGNLLGILQKLVGKKKEKDEQCTGGVAFRKKIIGTLQRRVLIRIAKNYGLRVLYYQER